MRLTEWDGFTSISKWLLQAILESILKIEDFKLEVKWCACTHGVLFQVAFIGSDRLYYLHRWRGYCVWVRLFVCLSVCLFVWSHRTFVFFSATTCKIETKFSPYDMCQRLMQNDLIIMTSQITWCGSHVGKMGKKTWTSVSLKPHQGKH